MDEAEKYQQRLEAIAEKRRLQEEQDKAKREMEDEKLRLQQLKRKSLRDKWLMEGPPLSPTSPNSQSPHSPSWNTQAQDMEKHTDKLPSQTELMAEEQEKLKKQMEDDQQEEVKVAEPEAEIFQDILQNGENNATRSETSDNEGKVNQSPPGVKTTVLTNGGGELEANGNRSTPEQSEFNTNGPITATEVGVKLESETDVTEAELGQVPSDGINEEEEEGILVMRAECVLITDEGDDAPEEFISHEDLQESMQSDQLPRPNLEAGKETEEAVEEQVNKETAPGTLTEMEKSEAAEVATEAQLATENEDVGGDIKSSNDADEETTVEGQDEKTEDPNSADALEDSTVALVPAYPEVPLSTGTPHIEAEATTTSEGAEGELKVEEPACLPEQFQEVPLTDPQDQQKPGEQEPLLQKAEASNTKAESAGANSPGSPSTAGPGGDSESPKHKTCQCCSVM
ncbi:paralemmin-3 isoform X2 [Melanotaenia boesemani]|nr:paralemmin-3 isoform X2 [Melanotaenia boesemani]XP_041838809.1 paralemmin-3 isoform X2 [Melanotaenia boesemani]